ncbi:MAG: hypothetical protein V9F04_17315 [Dermatophilaceae bacterium]
MNAAAVSSVSPEVAVEEGRPAHLEVADRLAVVRDLAPVFAHEPGLDSRNGHADRAGPPHAIGSGRDRDEGLGHAIALAHLQPGESAQPVEHRRRQGRAARHEQPRRR